jgi:hypothetical protein
MYNQHGGLSRSWPSWVMHATISCTSFRRMHACSTREKERAMVIQREDSGPQFANETKPSHR